MQVSEGLSTASKEWILHTLGDSGPGSYPGRPLKVPMHSENRSLRSRTPTVRAPLFVLSLLVVLLLLYAGPGATGASTSAAPTSIPTGGSSRGVLPTGGAAFVSQPISPQFWGVNVGPTHPFNASDALLVNATPVQYIRYPGGNYAEQMNWTSSVITLDSGTTQTAVTTVADFAASCTLIHCKAILQLPAEINSSSTDGYYVSYVVRTLGFTPAYWEIGNAPASWTHFNAPWSTWANGTTGNTTPVGFANEVHRIIGAIRGIDSSTPIVGLASGMVGPNYDQSWIGALLSVDGSELAGISVHNYPGWTGNSSSTLADFYAALQAPWSLPNLIGTDVAYMQSACSTCATRLFVSEANANYGGGPYDGWLASFNDTLFLAAEVTQGLRAGAANIDWFDFQSNYPGTWYPPNGVPRPDYYLFSLLLNHLGNATLNVPAPGPGTLYTAATTNGSAESFLAVNVNLTSAVNLNLTPIGFASGTNVTERYWPTGDSRPVQSQVPGGSIIQLAALSIALFTTGPGGGGGPPPVYPVTFQEQGLTAGTSWSTTLGGVVKSSTLRQISYLEANGSVSFSVAAVAGYTTSPSSGQITVAGQAMNRDITFSPVSSPPPLSVSVTSSPQSLYLGNQTVIAATAGGGAPPYTFSYPQLPSGCVSTSLSSLDCTPTATGTFAIQVDVSDAGHNLSSAMTNVTILPTSTTHHSPPATTSTPTPWYEAGSPPTLLLALVILEAALAAWGAVAIVRYRRKIAADRPTS